MEQEKMGVERFLSKTERRIFDVCAECVSIKEAATRLGVEPQVLYNFFYKTRKKYEKRRGWVNAVLAQKKRSKLLRRVLTSKEYGLVESEVDEEESGW
ncbi:MAG: hypothetical protein DRP02_12330 [Candidatus Gerdarchaeota archaeon]|nr:MAG: hypothetical protein DRP02_12330 [Candidatus Gerdarchaeota archaeon]